MTTGGRTKLGLDLDELRLLVGLSYRELARRTGCARSTLHDALTGRRFPRLDTVLAIARACGGDTACWRKRWVAASKRTSVTPPSLGLEDLLNLLDIPPDQIETAVAKLQRRGQAPRTAPTMSRQSTKPS